MVVVQPDAQQKANIFGIIDRKSLASTFRGIALFLGSCFFCVTVLSCNFGILPAWNANARTCVKVSIGSVTGSGGRAVAAGSGYLYIQTGIAPGAVTLYGPYTPNDSVYNITDIPAGTHKPFIFLYAQSVPTAGVLALSPSDATKSGYLAALQNLWQADSASIAGSSFGYLDSVDVLSGQDTVIKATLVPTTDISVAYSGSKTITGIAGQSVRRFVKITGMKAAFPGQDPATVKMTCSLSTPTGGPVTVSAVGLYDASGAKIKYDLSASILNSGDTRAFDAAWSGDDAYYLYVDFTGSSLQCSFSAATIPTHTVTFNSNGGTGTMASMTMFEGSSANLSACSFTKSGYTCSGWSTTSGSTTPTYADGASFTMGTSDVTLYAIWADTIPPVISSLTLGSATYLEFNVTEMGSGLKSISLSGDVQSPIEVTFTSYGNMIASSVSGTTITLDTAMQCDGRVFVLSGYIPSAGSGLKTIYVSMTDGAGNVSVVSSASITLADTTPPIVTVTPGPGTDCTDLPIVDGSNVYVGSGGGTLTYSITDDTGIQGTPTISGDGTVSGSTITVPSTGGSVHIQALDLAGNATNVTFSVIGDSTGPTVSGPTTTATSVTFTAGFTGSPCASYSVYETSTIESSSVTTPTFPATKIVDGATCEAGEKLTSGLLSLTAAGYHYVKFLLYDRLGNVSTYVIERHYDGSSYTCTLR